MQRINKLIFYCPSEHLGGSEILLSRLAIKSSFELNGPEIYILDINGGILSKLCIDTSNIGIVYDLADIPRQPSDRLVLFSPAKCLHQLYEILAERESNYFISIWQLGSGGLSETLFLPLWLKFKFQGHLYTALKVIFGLLFFNAYKQARKALSAFVEQNAIMFTDLVGSCDTFGDLNMQDSITKEIKIIPIFVDGQINRYAEKLGGGDLYKTKLRIGWLGRISSDFKIFSLTHAITSVINAYHDQVNSLEFHVVGNGDAMAELERLKVDMEQRFSNVKFVFYGFRENSESIEILLGNIDLAIGMGTSSLDLGKFGIPTIIISPVTSDQERHLIRFRWLYDSLGHSLGEFPNNKKLVGQISHSGIAVLIDEFMIDSKSVSNRTYDFVNGNFTTEIALALFNENLQHSTYHSELFKRQFKPIYKSRKMFKQTTRLYRPKWLPG